MPSIKEMKAAITRAGLPTVDLLERPDVDARYAEALARLAEAERLRTSPAPPPPPPEELDDLDLKSLYAGGGGGHRAARPSTPEPSRPTNTSGWIGEARMGLQVGGPH